MVNQMGLGCFSCAWNRFERSWFIAKIEPKLGTTIDSNSKPQQAPPSQNQAKRIHTEPNHTNQTICNGSKKINVYFTIFLKICSRFPFSERWSISSRLVSPCKHWLFRLDAIQYDLDALVKVTEHIIHSPLFRLQSAENLAHTETIVRPA